MIPQYGGTEKIESVSVCVVYDPLTGHIHHWHHCVTIVGGRHPSKDEIAIDALAAVTRGSPQNKRDLRVLHVDLPIEPGELYRVDHERQTLAVQAKPDLKK